MDLQQSRDLSMECNTLYYTFNKNKMQKLQNMMTCGENTVSPNYVNEWKYANERGRITIVRVVRRKSRTAGTAMEFQVHLNAVSYRYVFRSRILVYPLTSKVIWTKGKLNFNIMAEKSRCCLVK